MRVLSLLTLIVLIFTCCKKAEEYYGDYYEELPTKRKYLERELLPYTLTFIKYTEERTWNVRITQQGSANDTVSILVFNAGNNDIWLYSKVALSGREEVLLGLIDDAYFDEGNIGLLIISTADQRAELSGVYNGEYISYARDSSLLKAGPANMWVDYLAETTIRREGQENTGFMSATPMYIAEDGIYRSDSISRSGDSLFIQLRHQQDSAFVQLKMLKAKPEEL